MTRAQVERFSSRVFDLVNKIEEDEDASAEEQDVMVALLDCHEALEKIITRWAKH